MTSSPYLDAVGQYLRDDGWEIEPTQIQQGTVVIRGRQQSGESEQSIITMVVTAEAGQATPDHLKHLLETSREEGADLSILAAEPPISDELQAAAADNGVHILDDAELDLQASTESSPTAAEASTDTPSTADGEPIDADSIDEQQPVGADSTADQQSVDADSTDDPPFPDPWTLLKAYLGANLSRRRLVAGSALLVGGTAAGGYGWYRFVPSALERRKADAEEITYDELRTNVKAYLDTTVYYGPAYVAQRINADSGTRLRLQVTQDERGVWRDNLLGRWDGEPYSAGEIVEFWGVVTGSVSYETALGVDRTVPEVEIIDIATVEP